MHINYTDIDIMSYKYQFDAPYTLLQHRDNIENAHVTMPYQNNIEWMSTRHFLYIILILRWYWKCACNYVDIKITSKECQLDIPYTLLWHQDNINNYANIDITSNER